jgi:hypothetical protein
VKLPVPPADLRRRLGSEDAHGLATAVPAERHCPADEREQRVVLAPAYTRTRVEVRAALADDDLSRVHHLAAETLDAEALSVRVTAVAAG